MSLGGVWLQPYHLLCAVRPALAAEVGLTIGGGPAVVFGALAEAGSDRIVVDVVLVGKKVFPDRACGGR